MSSIGINHTLSKWVHVSQETLRLETCYLAAAKTCVIPLQIVLQVLFYFYFQHLEGYPRFIDMSTSPCHRGPSSIILQLNRWLFLVTHFHSISAYWLQHVHPFNFKDLPKNLTIQMIERVTLSKQVHLFEWRLLETTIRSTQVFRITCPMQSVETWSFT